jgi:hypothetical protein
MAIMLLTGDILSFFAISKATGATIKTVATLSTNAEIMPANNDNDIIAHLTFGIFSRMISASNAGIFDSMNNDTIPIVPAIIKITFQSTVENTLFIGNIPVNTKIKADNSAI